MKITRRKIVLAVAALVVLVLGGCSGWNDDRGVGDAPVDQMPDREIAVYPNGDRFPNIAAFCIGGNGVYTTTREAPPAITLDDPECDPGGAIADRGAGRVTEQSTEESSDEE